jgi:ABC-type glycerol-3-phosphate transport system substrate-binding protein
MPLDEFMTDDLKGLWADSLMDALKLDGKQYAIPIGVQNSFIAYNKKLFDEAASHTRRATGRRKSSWN